MKTFFLLVLILCYTNASIFSYLESEIDFDDKIPDGDTHGACEKQSNKEMQKRVCRYGKCEVINDGNDFLCHCDSHITGRRCDMPVPVSQLGDSCASNPCWGESICITLSEDFEGFKCICFGNSQGKYCQQQIKKSDDVFKPLEAVAIEEVISDAVVEPTSSNAFEELSIIGLTSTQIITTSELSMISTTTIKPSNLFIPLKNVEPCNHNTCQLGRCLENGTCQCIEPAIGKYCEKINECIFLKCLHGNCITERGCVCNEGYTGMLCENEITIITTTISSKVGKKPETKASMHTTTSNKLNIIKLVTLPMATIVAKRVTTKTMKTTTPAPDPTTTTSTITTTTSSADTTTTTTTTTTTSTTSTRTTTTTITTTSTSTIATTTTTTTTKATTNVSLFKLRTKAKIGTSTTTQLLTVLKSSCDNGGIFIDNTCICLNFFTGDRCEIPPGNFIDDQSNLVETSIESIDSNNTTVVETTKKIDDTTRKHKIFTKYNKNPDETMFWPWFECFPGNSKVKIQVENGTTELRMLSDLQVGDLVLVTSEKSPHSLTYSPVVTFLHKIREANAKFTKITFTHSQNNESAIILTPKHLIYASKSNNERYFDYVAANQVEKGDYLKYYDQLKNEFEYVQVKSIELIQLNKSGIYAPLTKTGTIIVNNIQVSCYSMVKSHYLTQKVFSFLNNFKNIFNIDSNFYVKYAKFLFNIVNNLNLSSLFLNI